MSPGPTNTQMFSREAQAEAALEQAEEALEKSQQENGALKDVLEDIDDRAVKMRVAVEGAILDLQNSITDAQAKFADF